MAIITRGTLDTTHPCNPRLFSKVEETLRGCRAIHTLSWPSETGTITRWYPRPGTSHMPHGYCCNILVSECCHTAAVSGMMQAQATAQAKTQQTPLSLHRIREKYAHIIPGTAVGTWFTGPTEEHPTCPEAQPGVNHNTQTDCCTRHHVFKQTVNASSDVKHISKISHQHAAKTRSRSCRRHPAATTNPPPF